MNQYQQANAALAMLLGEVGRSVWLSVRVDGKSMKEVAREHKLTVGRVKDILASSDFAIEQANIVQPNVVHTTYEPAVNGFHQTEDV